MRIVSAPLLLVIIAASVCAGDAAPQAPAIKKIVLYKHGIGYFERHGKVNGNANVTLNFKTEQMKDVLKSLFVLDLNGGNVSTVVYETKDPLAKQLQGIEIDVPEHNALSAFLVQLKGAKVTVSIAGEKITGRILGVEPITERTKDGQVLRQDFKLVLLTDKSAIRSVDLYSITEFTLDDAQLQRDLDRLLTVSLGAKYTDRKTVTVQAQGEGERELRLGYLVEQPIWKASYRVLLDKDEEQLLQGWALAENNTEDDWTDVELSFVAGNPLSYIMDLYESFYPERPRVPIPGLTGLNVDWAAAPEANALRADEVGALKELEDLRKDKKADYSGRNRGVAEERAKQAGGPGAPPAKPMAGKELAEVASRSMAAVATGSKVGELFSYQAKEKVSIPRNKAAMVPIIVQKMKGERIVYYKAAFSPRPVDAYIMKNNSALTFEAGAVTFFEGSTSLGSGILSHVLVPGAKEIIPYAVDASVTVTPEVRGDNKPAHRGSLANGYLTLTSVQIQTSTWKLNNKGKEDKTVVFDQPITPGYKLVQPEKPEEEADGHYRFRVALKAGEIKEFKVIEQRDVAQTIYLASIGEEQIRFYARQEYFSDKAKQFLKELADMQAQRAAIVRVNEELKNQMQRFSEEQRRLRDNLNTLRQTAKEEELRAKWVKSLSDAEEQLVAQRQKIDANNEELRKLDEALAKKVTEYKGE